VLLMARLPFLERSYGQDELARLHRLVGFTSFNLLLAHVVLVLIGYAQTARRGVLAETWDVLTTYPGMLLAVAGFAALVMVVVTSLRAARRRLRYESWHLLHLYAYLGAGLAVPHQLWTGQDFVTSPLARAYWWTIWLGTLAAVLVYRVGLPLARSLRHQLVVDRSSPSRPTSSRSTSADVAWTGCRCGPASSSSGASWTGQAGARRTRTRCPPRRPLAGCD
jgi:DMSO/TMAO reductase YedYZ heme-binding membrane subunit